MIHHPHDRAERLRLKQIKDEKKIKTKASGVRRKLEAIREQEITDVLKQVQNGRVENLL